MFFTVVSREKKKLVLFEKRCRFIVIFNINKCKLPVNEKYINNVCPILLLWNGSTLICCLSVRASSISFFFTHCEKRNPNKIQIQNYNFSKIADLLNVKEI